MHFSMYIWKYSGLETFLKTITQKHIHVPLEAKYVNNCCKKYKN